MVNQEKRDEIESICYMMKWEIGQCEITPNEWYWKRCPEREKIDIEKDAQKGKMIDMKKDAQMGKECDENDENGLPNVNLPI